MSEVTQYEGILTYVDAAGNETEMYPEVKTDKSLTVSGKAADAKAVGEALKNSGGKAINLTQKEYDALPEEEKKNGIYVTPGGADLTAKNLAYDGSVTGLGNNVQDAVDNLQDTVSEQNKNLEELMSSMQSQITYETGTFSDTVGSGWGIHKVQKLVVFSQPFVNVPTVKATHSGNEWTCVSLSISSITQTGFIATLTDDVGINGSEMTVTWIAEAKAV